MSIRLSTKSFSAHRGLMKRDPICVGCKDSGLDLSRNDLAETMIDEVGWLSDSMVCNEYIVDHIGWRPVFLPLLRYVSSVISDHIGQQQPWRRWWRHLTLSVILLFCFKLSCCGRCGLTVSIHWFQLDELFSTVIQRTTLLKWNSRRFVRRTWCLALSQVLTRCYRWHSLTHLVAVSSFYLSVFVFSLL